MKVGILGGTFNPIHYGHLIIAEHIRVDQNLDKIIFIPTGLPPHKDRLEVLGGEARSKMVDLAIGSNPYFHLSTIEVDNREISYTIDTVNSLKKENPIDEFYLIIGGDSLMEIKTWKGFKELIGSVNIIVADRYGACGQDIMDEIKRLNKDMNSNIVNINTPIIDISSTEIRRKLREKKSIKYLLPENVENYIRQRGIYSHEKP